MTKKSAEENATQEAPQEQPLESKESAAGKSGKKEKRKSTSGADQMEQLRTEIGELKDQNLRLYAEFENFRKRNARERLELSTRAGSEIVSDLLPVLDDFERALRNLRESEANNEIVVGIELIYNKLSETLKRKGLKPMDSTIGKKFNVDEMEAITKIPAPEPDMAGNVLDEVERGYFFGDKILRYAKVVVAAGENTES